jgi:tRNA threonylcarbamoyladenosine biosynthesis protein TsaE
MRSDGLRTTSVEQPIRTTFLAQTEADTVAAGRDVGRTLDPGMTVLLFGELGAGKTAFVRGIAEGLGLDADAVTSPTFTIVQEYRGVNVTLQHIDLYRLSHDEIVDLALEDLEAPGTVLAIEWAERLPEPRLAPVVEVQLEHVPEGRRITIADGRA